MNGLRLRLGLLVLLVLLVLPGLAHAKPLAEEGRTATHEAGQVSVLDRALHWVAAVFMKAGSFIDPAGIDGGHSQPTVVNGIDAGSFIDPAGGH
jgi:hypothetical protein